MKWISCYLLISVVVMAGEALEPRWTADDTEFVKNKLWFSAPRPTIAIPYIKASPEIDGRADEPCWKDATTINTLLACKGTLVPALSRWGIDPAYGESQIKLFWNDEAIYAYFKCPEPDMPSVQKKHTGKDVSAWQDDCVEFFFDTNLDRLSVYHLIVNPAGGMYDARETGKRDEKVKEEKGWNWEGLVLKTTLEKDFWGVEVKFPFAGLGVKPEKGDHWGMNLCRQRWASGPWWSGTWSGIPDTFFGAPDMLGDVVFDDIAVEVLEMPQPFLGPCPARIRIKNLGRKPRRLQARALVSSTEQEYEAGKASVRVKPSSEKILSIPFTVNTEGLQFASLVLTEGKKRLLVERRGMRILSPKKEVARSLSIANSILERVKGRKLESSVTDYITKLEELKRKIEETRTRFLTTEHSPEKSKEWLRLHAEAVKAGSLASYVVWTKSPWLPAPSDDFPDSLEDTRKLTVEACINEYEPAVLNITNLTPDYLDVLLEIKVAGLKEVRAQLLTPANEIVRNNPKSFGFEEARGFALPGETGEPLIRLSEPPELVIAPFSTRQLWLAFHTASMKASLHRGSIRLQVLNKALPDKVIPIELRVWNFEIPDRPTLGVFCYDYTGSNEAGLEDLLSHKVTYSMGPDILRYRLKKGKFSVDTSDAKRTIRLRLKHGLKRGWGYGFCLDFYRWAKARGITLDSPEFKKYWKEAVKAMVDLHKELELDFNDYAVGVWDEVSGKDVDIAIKMLKMAKEVEPRLRFANTITLSPRDRERMKDLIDIWIQAGGAIWDTKFYEGRKKAGSQVWVYTCRVPVRAQSPMSYFRSAGWRAGKFNLDGIAFFAWSYLVYQKDGKFIPNRAWEAWREGIEDWQYIHKLRTLIAELRKKGTDKKKLKECESRLQQIIDRVITDRYYPPETAETSERIYQARRDIASMILSLEKLR